MRIAILAELATIVPACSGSNQLWIIVVGNDGNARILNPAEGLVIYNRLDSNSQ